jgi:hypothetical protein
LFSTQPPKKAAKPTAALKSSWYSITLLLLEFGF